MDRSGSAERRIDLGGVELSVLEAGVGAGSRLLMVHGFTGAKEDFAAEVPRLAADGLHVVAPDLRGHGSSSKPESVDDYSLEIFADDMWALADSLGWDTFGLLGHSMGGMIAEVMVTGVAERIERLVLMDTHHGVIGGLDPTIISLGVQIALDQGLQTIHELLNMGESPLGTAADLRYREAHPDYGPWCDRKFFACSKHMYAAMLAMFNDVPDRLESLTSVTCPTLVMVGDEDTPFLDASKRMADAIGGARLDVIPGGGHSPQFEAREEWRRSIDRFLAVTRSPSG